MLINLLHIYEYNKEKQLFKAFQNYPVTDPQFIQTSADAQ